MSGTSNLLERKNAGDLLSIHGLAYRLQPLVQRRAGNPRNRDTVPGSLGSPSLRRCGRVTLIVSCVGR